MTSSTIGLLLEIVLFLAGVYVYLFSRGAVKFGDAEARARAENFRRDNAGWMRILGLLLAAIMLVNIALHVGEMMGGS